jgi:predicted Zn-dependent peptidase
MTNEEILKESTKIGGGFNAATDKDVTYYYFKTSTENYRRAIKIFAEILCMPGFKQSDLEAERHVILEELNTGLDNDNRLLWHLSTLSVLESEHPYSKKVIGTKETLLSLKSKDLYDYFDEHYNDYTIVVNCERSIQGDVRNLLQRLFKNYLIKKPEGCDETVIPHEIQRKVIVINKPLNQNSIVLTFPLFESALCMKKVLLLEFISFVLSGAGLYSLLTYQLREKRGLIYNVASYNDNMKYLSTFRISLSTTSQNVEEILNIIFKVLNKLRTKGLENLSFFKDSFYTAFKLNMSSEDYRTLVIGAQIYNTDGNDVMDIDIVSDMIKKITNHELIEMSKTIFDKSNLGIVCVGDFQGVQEMSKSILQML